MANSGHTMGYTRKVLMAGIQGFERKLANSKLAKSNPAYRPLHMGTNYNSLGRWKKKVMSRESWYEDKEMNDDEKITVRGSNSKKKIFQKAGGRGVITSTVMFIPSTRGGKLTAMMKENEEKMASMTKFKVKYQEAGGMKLAMLFNTNLEKGEHCQRQECQSCNSRSEDRPNCKTQSILYESKCRECNPVPSHEEIVNKAPRRGIFVGEMSRSLFERSLEP